MAAFVFSVLCKLVWIKEFTVTKEVLQEGQPVKQDILGSLSGSMKSVSNPVGRSTNVKKRKMCLILHNSYTWP